MNAAPLALYVSIGGEPWLTLDPPEGFQGRDWILGVVAVQAFYAPGQGLTARVRAHRTGMPEARERPLSFGEPVDVEIREGGAAVAARRSRSRAVAHGGPACLAAYLGPSLFARSELPDAAGTALRAFGHVFVRWRRDAPPETGVDLTAFAPPGSGEMFGRLRSETLASGAPVTYQVDAGLQGWE